MTKRKGLTRVTVIFVVILLLITFLSRSVLYFVTPKVLVSRGLHDIDGGILLPLTALLNDDSVYVLRTKNGFMGEVLILENVKISLMWRDETRVSVSGLAYTDMVVTDWDRELRDGQRVMLPLQ